MTLRFLLLVSLVVSVTASAGAGEPGVASEPGVAAVASLSKLVVYPARIQLDDRSDRTRLLVQGELPDGTTRDLTDSCRFTLAAPLARLEGSVLVPLRDGETTLVVRYGSHESSAAVVVSQADAARELGFRNDCVPALTRAGCNMGSCHGSSRGKDGFRLSLFGYDPEGDYFRVTRELAGRRINLAAPNESLLLLKATGAVRHTGGQRFSVDDPLYRTLLAWIQAGAQPDPTDQARLTGLALHPSRAVLLQAGGGQRLLVQARYADATDRDVSGLTTFASSDASIASVSSQGVIVPGRRGEAWITARFGEFTVGTQVLVVPPAAVAFPPNEPGEHFVDRLVDAKLRQLRVPPAPLADDATFLRRVTLDVTGQLPTPDEVRAFLADERPGKRSARVDELLARKEFVELWVMLWSERLMIRSSDRVSPKAALRYAKWLEDQLARNVPLDAMVRDLLTAQGGVFDTPQTNFYQAEADTKKVAENVAQVFLGIRMQCAQCHNHPFDRWTQDDYYGWAAFFAQLGRKKGGDPRETIVFDARKGEVNHPVSGKPRPPTLLGGGLPEIKNVDRRQVAAEWITAADNPWFARNLANMVWTHFFGVGLVHEPDDVRVSNPPSNPALLDALAQRLRDSNYDVRELVRTITSSRTYQRATSNDPANAHDMRNYARARLRRLRAEVLLDAIAQVTEAPNDFRGLPKGARAVQIADGAYQDYFLTAFGRARRESVCSCEVSVQPNLSQALHLLNGATVNQKIRQGGLIPRLLKEGKANAEVAEELYLRCFGRLPTPAELSALAPRLEGGKRRARLEDLFWALLNSREFLFSH